MRLVGSVDALGTWVGRGFCLLELVLVRPAVLAPIRRCLGRSASTIGLPYPSVFVTILVIEIRPVYLTIPTFIHQHIGAIPKWLRRPRGRRNTLSVNTTRGSTSC